MHSLSSLDAEFDDLWFHTEQLPKLLETWQEKVGEYLQQIQNDKEKLDELSPYIDRWQQVMRENRSLFEAHQATLKPQIKQGEPNDLHEKKSKKYKGR